MVIIKKIYTAFYSNLHTLTIAMLMCLNIFCTNTTESHKNKTAIHDTVSSNSLLSDSILIKVNDSFPSHNINLATAKIEILSIDKEIMNKDTLDKYYGKCKLWSLTSDQIKTVIREFKPISSELQNLAYLYMPCRVIGKIKIDNTEFKYFVNAGSTLTLLNKDTTLYFGCSSKKCKIFFLSGKND